MKISYVEIAGFRGFKDKVRFAFPAGFVVLTGRNGAGKSTVLDAIDFALTGTIDKFAEKRAKGGGLSSHIWWVGEGRPTEQFVRIGFQNDNGEEFSITRARDKDLVPPLKDIGAHLCRGSLAEEWPRTLIQTTLIRDETLASLSMDLPEQARFEAVRAAIGGLTGPDHTPRTASISSAAKAAKAQQDDKVAQLQAELGRALSALTEARSAAEKQPDIAEAERAIQQVAPDLDTNATDLAEKLRRRIADRKQSAQAIRDLAAQAEGFSSERSFFASEGKNEIERSTHVERELAQRLSDAVKEHEAAAALLAAEQTADRFASQMIGLLTHGEEIGLIDGHCPLCDAVRSDAEFANAVREAKERLSERGEHAALVRSKALEAQAKLRDAEQAHAQARQTLEALRVRQTDIEASILSIGDRLRAFRLESLADDPGRLRLAALKRQEDTGALEHALFVLEASGAHDRVVQLEARIEQLRSSIDEESIKATNAERAVESARQIENAAKTIANQVLTEQFDTVMPLLKELYLRLRPHTDWREIETDFGGKIRASLNFTVGEGRNPQFLFSSGQRRAAGMAFLLAIHLSRPWSKLETLLLDDPVQHIDDYRALNLVEVLSAVRKLGRQVIVAVEDPALADLLCRRLRSLPSERGHRYDLSMNANGSASIEKDTALSPLPAEILRYSEAS